MSACRSCRTQARLVVSQASASAVPRASAMATRGLVSQTMTMPTTTTTIHTPRVQQTRPLSTTPARPLLNLGRGRGAYFVVGATERLYAICGEAANYEITEEERRADKVERLEDGEEVGHSIAKHKVWHECKHPSSPGYHTRTQSLR